MHDGWQNALDQGKACQALVDSRPEYTTLRPHLTFAPTAAELADTAVPTVAEAQLLRDYTISLAPCQDALRTQLAASDPPAAQAVEQLFFDRDSIRADLIARKITWGDAARRRQQATIRFYLGES
jgi:hypothetical protein